MKKLLVISIMLTLCAMLFAYENVEVNIDPTSKTNIYSSGSNSLPYVPDGVMLTEGFETAIPPAGWDTLITSGTAGGTDPIYWYQDAGYAHTGAYGATCGWGYNVDVLLWIDPLDLTGASSCTLSFWWKSSYYWYVDPYDNGDLFVEVSTDGGTSWIQLWTFGDSADVVNSGGIWPWVSWDWYQATLSLDAYADQNILLGFHNVHNDAAYMAIDDVQIDTISILSVEETPVNIGSGFVVREINSFTSNPGIYLSSSEVVDVKVEIFDVTGRSCAVLFNGSFQGERVFSYNTNSSGIYIYRITANENVVTGKLISAY